ncbi:GNAT family N-acetyltransferase [Streptomyces sp. B1866]|uniref:GNAT family N-acetyltransferase n=1 Tax=Streptomyces sp. B1866 TaxID=3075431 RepID=UPI0028914FBA|nr:GNAT family N-acetyltransferase [Streptomyces sp. B1866]MDT3397281.1 GNAT family N-acetyltransferase [Streptomyces sp. B1866]
MRDADATTRLSIRPYEPADQAAVLALVDADLVTGQPSATPEMLAEALAGRSPVDTQLWQELAAPATDVARDAHGRVRGAVSYAPRPSDGAGFVLWLHGREEPAVLSALVGHALARLGPRRTVHAFEYASALGLGLAGLPVRHRHATRAALEEAGFAGRDLWRYMHAALPIDGLPRAPRCRVEDSTDPPGRRLTVRGGEGDTELWGEALVRLPVAGIGLLCWLGVEEPHRRRGLGAGLLGSALGQLAELGATEAILYVDDDSPDDDPEYGRGAAKRLYDRTGFAEVDRLWSFTRRSGPGSPPGGALEAG